jgi:hypothetical protein
LHNPPGPGVLLGVQRRRRGPARLDRQPHRRDAGLPELIVGALNEQAADDILRGKAGVASAAAWLDLAELDYARMQWLREILSDGVPGDAVRVLELCDAARRPA